MGERNVVSGIDSALDFLNRGLAPFVQPFRGDKGEPGGTIDRIDRLIDSLLFLLAALLLIAMTGTVSYAIFMRYAFNLPPLWSEAVPMVFFIWMTFLALGVATRRGDHIRVTYFIDKLSPYNRLVLELIMHALVIAMMAVIFWYSFTIIGLQMRGTMLSTGWSKAVIWFPLPFGMAMMILYQFKRIRWTIRNYRRSIEPEDERR